MTEEQTVPQAGRPASPPMPHIGAFVLETLTLGMYGEPRHTLREYIQNAFDSVQLAMRNRWMTGRGSVEVELSEDAISIRDNGTGIPSAQAWATLTSLGASKKDRQRDAGFRGIGRLAGMAYCDHLIFRTRFAGEDVVSQIEFDCVKLLKAMSPDDGGEMELGALLQDAISSAPVKAGPDEDEHFFEVRMVGLSNAPSKLTDAQDVRDYLSETSPVAYPPGWSSAELIEAGYQKYFGAALQTIDVHVTADGSREQIFKPYGDLYAHSKGQARLGDVEFEEGPGGSYWGWVGRLDEVVAVVDDKSRGLRGRVRNIQIDGTELFHALFTSVSPSYGRLSNYFVGEIFIDPGRIVPNARRDGFEETMEWIRIKRDLSELVCRRLAIEIYDASSKQQLDVSRILEDVAKVETRTAGLIGNARATYDQVVDVLSTAKRVRKRAVSALRSVQDVEAAEDDDGAPPQYAALRDAVETVEGLESETATLLGRVMNGPDDRLEALRERIREELLREMLDVVKSFVDPSTFQRIRRELSATSY